MKEKNKRRRRSRRKPREKVEIARERIEILFSKAREEALKGNEEIARDLVREARKVAQKMNVRIPRKYSMEYCRKCNTYLIPSKTSIVRVNKFNKTIDVRCLRCGYVRRYRYK